MRKLGKFFTVFGILSFVAVLFFSLSLLLRGNEEIPISKEKVGIVKIYGVIRSADGYLNLLDRAEKDKSIKAIVLRVDSPGGVVGACQEIYEKVKEVRKKKPVVVSMGSVAASGGLYVSLPATKIVANPGTITGSIGVIVQSYNVSRLIKKIGIEVITIKSGKYKDLLNPFEKPNPEKIGILQNLVNNSYLQFVKAVSESRKIPMDRVKTFADGRVFTGEEAKKLGLVDYLGNFDRAVEIAKKLGNCPDAKVYYLKRRKSLIDRIFGSGTEEVFKTVLRVINGNTQETLLMYLFN